MQGALVALVAATTLPKARAPPQSFAASFAAAESKLRPPPRGYLPATYTSFLHGLRVDPSATKDSGEKPIGSSTHKIPKDAGVVESRSSSHHIATPIADYHRFRARHNASSRSQNSSAQSRVDVGWYSARHNGTWRPRSRHEADWARSNVSFACARGANATRGVSLSLPPERVMARRRCAAGAHIVFVIAGPMMGSTVRAGHAHGAAPP